MRLQITALNESPVFLLLDPAPRAGQKELPVHLYESGADPALFCDTVTGEPFKQSAELTGEPIKMKG